MPDPPEPRRGLSYHSSGGGSGGNESGGARGSRGDDAPPGVVVLGSGDAGAPSSPPPPGSPGSAGFGGGFGGSAGGGFGASFGYGGDSASRVSTAPTLVRVGTVHEGYNAAVDYGRRRASGGERVRRVAPFPPQRTPRFLRALGIGRTLVVEGLPYGERLSVVWASDVLAQQGDPYFPLVETEAVSVEPCRSEELARDDAEWEERRAAGGSGALGVAPARRSNYVYQGDQWEVRVKGMQVESFDWKILPWKNDNELILYSMETEAPCGGGVEGGAAAPPPGDAGAGATSDAGAGAAAAEAQGAGGPASKHGDAESAPKIHFDYKKDYVTRPDTFQPTPNSKSLVTDDCGRNPRKSVNVRFTILEVDKVSDSASIAIDGVEALTSQLTEASLLMPYLAVLTPALSVAGKLGQSALDAYAQPDHVVSIDMSFRLLTRGRARNERSGEYLRYGYVFFLSRAVPYKLYAATRDGRYIRLMLRAAPQSAPRPYIPLTHVSYLVVKVGVPAHDLTRRRRPLGRDHARRLQDAVENVDSLPPEQLHARIAQIMHELRGTHPDAHASASYVGATTPP